MNFNFNSNEEIEGYLVGLIIGDGHIEPNTNRTIIASNNEEFITKISNLFDMLEYKYSVFNDISATVLKISVNSAKLHKTLTHHKQLISSLDWHPDSVQIASASVNKHIAVTNTTDGSTEQLKPKLQHQARIVKWSHCGKALFVGFSNGGLETPPLPAQQPTESKSNK